MSEKEFEIPDFIREHMPVFLSNRASDLKMAQELLQLGDKEGLHNIFHRIYGIAAPYGLVKLGVLSRQIIDHCKQDNLAQIHPLLLEIEHLLQRVKQSLE